MDKKKGTGEPDQISRQEPGPEEELCGLDLVDMTPNYFKTPEEDAAIIAKRYKKVYGKWPPWMPEGPGQESTEE